MIVALDMAEIRRLSEVISSVVVYDGNFFTALRQLDFIVKNDKK